MRKNVFNNFDEYDGDIYVADYTEYAKRDEQFQGKGVVFSNAPFAEIKSLHLVNARHIKVTAVNFEKNSRLFLDDEGHLVKQCEGLCFASHARKHGWVLLIELKYCQEKNIQTNVDATIVQLRNTLSFMRDNLGAIEKRDRVYWVSSMPDHSDKAPFESFVYSPDDLLKLQEELGIIMFFRYNEVFIKTDAHLFAMR